MRNLRKKLHEKREAKGEAKDGTGPEVKKAKETNEKPKAKRGKKRKIEDTASKTENEEERGIENGE